ncbi:MAG: TolC family protein [Granulosicoccus sp.]|nr:TolC family protein [Granulosicoccus sp.]
MNDKTFRNATLTLSVLTLTACTTVPKDSGLSDVQAIYGDQSEVAYRLPRVDQPMPMTSDELNALLQDPLSVETAERISVESNPMVKAKIATVGIAEADYAQAGRMENPGLAYERFSAEEYSASLLFDIGGVLLMPLKRKMEGRRLEAARFQAARDVLSHIADTRKAWINAVAERQQTTLVERAVETAETSNNLTRQMTALGHSNVIESAQSELILGELRQTLIRQRLSELAARESLVRQLGLWGEQARSFSVPDQLPGLPNAPIDFPAVEREAVQNRLDVQMAKSNLESMAKNLSLNRLNPFLSAIELGPVWEAAEGERERGYEIELRLPIFDAGGVKTQKARIVYEQAKAQAETAAIAAASAARQALFAYQSSWDIANHMQKEVLPIRKRISEEQLLMYNGMLISVFDLLRDLLSATTIESNYVNALRDFWLADTRLQNTLTGAGDGEMNFSGSAMMPANDAGAEH